jgi:outer membrane protein OmpA-like peptidoglycan-associated protein
VKRASLTLLAAAAIASGCGGAPPRITAVDEMDRVRGGPGAAESAALAPDAYAAAEREREAALAARASRDWVGASLHAERAVAGYHRAAAEARRGRAEAQAASAQKTLADATAQEQTLDASRAELEREATEVEARERVAREALAPVASPAVAAERDAARLTAARTYAVEARLLCGAAHLVAPAAQGLAEAERSAAADEAQLERDVHPAPIDEATRARARCLEALTLARRAAGTPPGSADALLAELSASGGWDPSRDERGVVVSLRGLFRAAPAGAALTDEGAARLADLGRVARAHAAFAVQVVIHAADPSAASRDRDARRAEAVATALVAAGADRARLHAELAGARLPVVDPADAANRARNERVEVVFVP